MRLQIFAFTALAMFSSVARAFTRSPVAKSLVQQQSWAKTAPRFLSTETPDTSIVDICSEKIKKALDADSVKVTGAYDDPNGSHISVEVVSSAFEGKRAVQRQQLVYKGRKWRLERIFPVATLFDV